MISEGEKFVGRYLTVDDGRAGGTATVFRAFDQKQGQQVALKIFNSGALDPDILNEIWNRESAALSKLTHRNIVRLLDAGRCEATNLRYIVLEWVDGKSLADALTEQPPMSFDSYMQLYGWAVLDALTFAAHEGVIHRDLSPYNIHIDPTGQPKIIDFGQSKVDSSNIGLTVAGYATPPYCPPEQDTGRYTETRDAFSFCTIAVRAISGKNIGDHDDLYAIFDTLKSEDHYVEVFQQALARDPSQRPSDIIEFSRLLKAPRLEVRDIQKFVLNLRLSPEVETQLEEFADDQYTGRERLLHEINEAVSISPVRDASPGTRFAIDTRSYGLIADLDGYTRTCIVIIGVSRRTHGFAQLWRPNTWQPEIEFLPKIPTTPQEKAEAAGQLERFFNDYDQFITALAETTAATSVRNFDAWERLLDAMTYLERNRVPRLHYRQPDVEGNRLTVDLENPEDAEIDQLRVIVDQGRPVFSGVVEAIDGPRCRLIANWPVLDSQKIPIRGALEADWNLARIAIQRQRNALEKFKNREIVNQNLGDLVSLKSHGDDTPHFAGDVKFINKGLDPDKKTIVSRFMVMNDLLLVQGPPGTGKTTLIVEMIQQYLRAAQGRRVLLACQTHVALDHAISGVLQKDENIKIVRIGSGNHELDEKVISCSIERRGEKLRSQVAYRTEDYIRRRADLSGTNMDEVRLGLRVIDVLRTRAAVEEARQASAQIQAEIQDRERNLKEVRQQNTSTTDIDALQASVETALTRRDEQQRRTELAEAQLRLAEDRLRRESADGKQLVNLDTSSLDEWRETLLHGPDSNIIRELMELAEEWLLKFGQSDDFKVAIIADSQIVGGTCVGFCREPAAASTEFDLCIIDEASKATTTELLVPMSQARQVVLVGDHHQLPAVLDYQLLADEVRDEYDLDEGQLESQLFEVLHHSLSEGNKAVLKTQFRMRSEIGDLIGECFYDGILSNAESCDDREVTDLALAGLRNPVTWYDTSALGGPARGERREKKSFYNPLESECIVGLLQRIAFVASKEERERPMSVGVVASYAAQVRYLEREIARHNELDVLNIECNTVHQFQGKEVDVCIYSITRDNEKGTLGFMTEWRNLNVALSRGRDYLVIVGSRSFCRSVPGENPFYNILNYIDRLGVDRFVETSDGNG